MRTSRRVATATTAVSLLSVAIVLAFPRAAVVAGAVPPILVLLALALGLATALARSRACGGPGNGPCGGPGAGDDDARSVGAQAPAGRGLVWRATSAAARVLSPLCPLAAIARRGATRFSRVGGAALCRLSGWRGAAVVFALVALSLLRAWAPLDRPSWQWPGIRPLALFHGRAQTSDALTIYASAQWLRHQGQTLIPGTRRPIYTAWVAATIGATGTAPQRILLLHALFLAVALHAATRAAGRYVGPAVALMVLGLSLGYSQQFVGLMMTESLGLALGLLAVALLLPTLRSWRALPWTGGMLALSTALLVRPGAQFVLPLAALAMVWTLRRTPRRALAALLLAAVAAGAALGTNAWLVARVGDPAAGANSNFGFVLYGLSVDQNWMSGQAHAQQHAADLSERERSAWLVREALDNMRQDPGTLAMAVARRVESFFVDVPPQTGLYLGDRGALVFWPPGWTPQWLSWTPAYLFWGAGGAAALLLRRRRHPGLALLLAATGVGVLLAVPFIWLDGQWRALAPTVPLQALFVSFYLAPRRPPADRPLDGEEKRWELTALSCVALVVLVGLGVAQGVIGRGAAFPLRTNEIDGSAPYIIADPAFASVLEIEPSPSFRWLGPAAMTLEQTRHEVVDWGTDDSLGPVLSRVQPTDHSSLLQTVSIAKPGGCAATLLLASPEQRAALEPITTPMAKLVIEWGEAMPYFGRFGVLRSIEPWPADAARAATVPPS